MYMEINQGFPW